MEPFHFIGLTLRIWADYIWNPVACLSPEWFWRRTGIPFLECVGGNMRNMKMALALITGLAVSGFAVGPCGKRALATAPAYNQNSTSTVWTTNMKVTGCYLGGDYADTKGVNYPNGAVHLTVQSQNYTTITSGSGVSATVTKVYPSPILVTLPLDWPWSLQVAAQAQAWKNAGQVLDLLVCREDPAGGYSSTASIFYIERVTPH